MLCEFHFKDKERGTAGVGEASGKAEQVSQMTMGPADLQGTTRSDAKVNK